MVAYRDSRSFDIFIENTWERSSRPRRKPSLGVGSVTWSKAPLWRCRGWREQPSWFRAYIERSLCLLHRGRQKTSCYVSSSGAVCSVISYRYTDRRRPRRRLLTTSSAPTVSNEGGCLWSVIR